MNCCTFKLFSITFYNLTSLNCIYDSISQLSATSEEVAASSGEGLNGFHVMFENLQKCREVFEAINRLAQELNGGYHEYKLHRI